MDGYERRKEWSKVKRPWEGKVEIRGRKEGKREKRKELESLGKRAGLNKVLTGSTPQGR